MLDISGLLSSFSFPEVLQLLTGGRLTGRLYIEVGQEEGGLYVENGDIMGAEFRDAEGMSALLHLAILGSGRFWFHQAKGERLANIPLGNERVLMELCRVFDEVDRAREMLESLGKESQARWVGLMDISGETIVSHGEAEPTATIRTLTRKAYDKACFLMKKMGSEWLPTATYESEAGAALLFHVAPSGLLVIQQARAETAMLPHDLIDHACEVLGRVLEMPYNLTVTA